MLSNKTLYQNQTIFLFIILASVARSDNTSTQQITPTSCLGYLVSATSTGSHSPSQVIAHETPTPAVINHQPRHSSPPENMPLSPEREGTIVTCPSAVQNCLTQEQEWPQAGNMYHDHRAVFGTLACIPFCWPAFASILAYGRFCNPPFAEDSSVLPSCYQPQPGFEFPATELGTLAALLSRHLNRALWYSDILVLWLNRILGSAATTSLQSYDAISAPPGSTLSTAVIEGVLSIIPSLSIFGAQLETSLTELAEHMVPYQQIPAENTHRPYTDVISILLFPMNRHLIIAIHQSGNSTSWMIIPQLQSSGSQPSPRRIDFIRRRLSEIAQQSGIPSQPTIILRLYIQRQ